MSRRDWLIVAIAVALAALVVLGAASEALPFAALAEPPYRP